MKEYFKFILYPATVLIALALVFYPVQFRAPGKSSGLDAKAPLMIGTAESIAQTSADLDITPAGISAVRPDVVGIGNYLYLHILKIAPGPHSYKLVKLDMDLKSIYTADIYSATNPTDARVETDLNGLLWYPFETVFPNLTPSNFLNVARYDISGTRPVLNAYKTGLASSVSASPPKIPARGTETMDDSTPFYYRGGYYILTKTYSSPTIYIRWLADNLSVLKVIRVDLRNQIGNYFLSPSVLTEIGAKTYLIAGIANGPKVNPTSSSRIVAIRMSDDLTQPVGSAITLTPSTEFASYVSAVRYLNNKLYILYNDFSGNVDPKTHLQEHIGRLGIYDTSTFKLLNALTINRGFMVDNHLGMEILGNSLYLFYSTPAQRIMARKIDLSLL